MARRRYLGRNTYTGLTEPGIRHARDSELPGVQCRLEVPGRVRPPVAVLRCANMLLQCLNGRGADLAGLGHIQVLLECFLGQGAERAVHGERRPVLVQRPLHGGTGDRFELSVDRELGAVGGFGVGLIGVPLPASAAFIIATACGPYSPSTVSPCLRWKASTASLVAGPKSPSTASFNPITLFRFCCLDGVSLRALPQDAVVPGHGAASP